jgi:glucan 1,3-beta-glucosidase
MVHLASVAYQVFGVDYSPYVGSQSPNSGTPPSDDQIMQQLELFATYAKGIRTYSCTGQEHVPQIAKQLGLKVYMGVWIGTDATTNQSEINTCVAIARSVGVDAIIVGSEALLNGYVSPQQLIAYIGQVRAAVPGIPISTADTNTVLENNPDVVAVCDFVFANYYPFWEGIDVSTAMGTLNAEDAFLRATYAPKEVIVSETGWKSFGAVVGSATPSPENAASYFLDFESWAQAEKRKTFYFEAHDEPWKGTDDGWGIWDENLAMKPDMMAVFNGQTVADNWSCNAVPGGSGAPLIQFTSVPPLGSTTWLQGQEWHAPATTVYVVVYIHVGSLGWWVKPYAANPITLLNCDGSWTANIVTGGEDASADSIAAFLIPITYNPPILEGASNLPPELYSNSIANVTVNR